MSSYLSKYLPIYLLHPLSVTLSSYQFISLFNCALSLYINYLYVPSTCLSKYLSTHLLHPLSITLSIYQLISLSLTLHYPYISIFSTYLSTCLSKYPPTYILHPLSISLSTYQLIPLFICPFLASCQHLE